MTPEQLTALMRETLYTAFEIAAPFLLLVLIVGLLISFLQTVTHLQEMTLSFVPKMLILTVALAIFFPWILKMMTKFTHSVWIDHWEKVVTSLHYGN